jgi:hypothetical protein
MPAFLPAPRWKALIWIACAALGAVSCGKREDSARGSVPPSVVPGARPDSGSERARQAADSDSAAASDSASAEPAAAGKPFAFLSHPPKAYLGKVFAYQPAFDFPGTVRISLLKAADSTMQLRQGRLQWTPARPGRFPVLLAAEIPDGSGPNGEHKIQQGFTLEVAPVLDLVLKPLPPKAHKGDTVVFDLRGSHWPAWAEASLSVRFDWDGDGAWDTEGLPLASHLASKHAYGGPGRFAPKVEGRYGNWEVRPCQGAITIVGSVTASLRIVPDTVEPGGDISVDASASRGDSRLAYFLDLDGDGKPEWADSAGGKAVLKAPASGLYHAKLTARDAMGESDQAEATLKVNARPKIEFRVRNPKDNMAASVDFKIRAQDPDDSIRSVRFSYTGGSQEWETRSAPDSQASGHAWYLRMKHAYGKPGSYAPKACVLAADGREACQELKVEIFNAPPECRPGADLRATLGQPVAIDGSGTDPDGTIVKWEWDLDGDGKYDLASTENGKFQYTFGKEGAFKLTLRVTTADGMTAIGSRKVEVRKKWKT